jgi:DNA-binding MarR family transcriptional regulator
MLFLVSESSLLQREIRQGKPFPSPAHECVLALMRTADVLRRSIGEVIEQRGLTPQQFNVLRILRGAGSAGLPTLEVAERMIEETPGVTRLLDRLEAKGWVRRQRCPKDRRQHLCWITPAGHALVGRLDEPLNVAIEKYLKPLRRSDQVQLIHLLEALRGGCSAASCE